VGEFVETLGWDEEPVPRHLWRFAREHWRLVAAAEELKMALECLLDDSAIRAFRVEARAKAIVSYEGKSDVKRHDGQLKYASPADDIQDCVAARLIMFTDTDLEAACHLIRTRMKPREDKNPGRDLQNGYYSRHFVVANDNSADWASGDVHLRWFLDEFPGLEIQVRTVAAHAWAEYEHHTRFKPAGYQDLLPIDKQKVDRLFTEAAEFRQEMDRRFGEIEAVLREPSDQLPESTGETRDQQQDADVSELLDVEAFSQWLNTRYPTGKAALQEAVAWMTNLVAATGLISIDELEQALDNVDSEQVASLMDYQFEPSSVRRLDDELLSALGQNYIKATSKLGGNRYQDRGRVLGFRLGRLKNKIRVYELKGADVPAHLKNEQRFSGAAAFRHILQIAFDRIGADKVLIENRVSTRNDLAESTHSKKLGSTNLWVDHNLSRSSSETYMAELLQRLGQPDIQVYRAGVQILPALSVSPA